MTVDDDLDHLALVVLVSFFQGRVLECAGPSYRWIALVIVWALGIEVTHCVDIVLIEMLNIFTIICSDLRVKFFKSSAFQVLFLK